MLIKAFLSYYDRENSPYIIKYNLRTDGVEALIPVSGYIARKTHYRWNGYTGMDLAVDEQGLWALWGKPRDSYQLQASRIDAYKNVIVQTWSLNTGN